jgi:hypothetical protein
MRSAFYACLMTRKRCTTDPSSAASSFACWRRSIQRGASGTRCSLPASIPLAGSCSIWPRSPRPSVRPTGSGIKGQIRDCRGIIVAQLPHGGSLVGMGHGAVVPLAFGFTDRAPGPLSYLTSKDGLPAKNPTHHDQNRARFSIHSHPPPW